MTEYVKIQSKADDDVIVELPLEGDETLLISTLSGHFLGATGLQYKDEVTDCVRGLRIADNKIHPPDSGWNHNFIAVIPDFTTCCTCGKRKSSEDSDNMAPKKSLRLDSSYNQKCVDLVVLDLPFSSEEEDVRSYFSEFGTVAMVQIKKDQKTRQSKGFGFIRFEDLEVQKMVLSMKHTIGGRECMVRIPKSADPSNPHLSGKLFVGRITEDMTDSDLRSYFEQFGEMTYVYLPRKPFRSFAYIQYASPEVARYVCDEAGDHYIKTIHVVVAPARPKANKSSNNSNAESTSFQNQKQEYNNGFHVPSPTDRWNRFPNDRGNHMGGFRGNNHWTNNSFPPPNKYFPPQW